MTLNQGEPSVDTGMPLDDDRRKFLASCGKFAAVTPPAITLLLSTSLNSTAIAYSGGRGGDWGGRGNDRDGRGNDRDGNADHDGSRNGREHADR